MRGDVIGFRVSGVGRDTNSQKGTIFYKGPTWFDPSNYSSLSDYEWIRALIELPREDEVSATPAKAELSLPAYTPKVAMTLPVSKILRARQRKPPYELSSGIGDDPATDDSIQLASGSTTAFSSGDDIYIGDETMKVVSEDGGGAYTVERAIWDSNIISHGPGAGIYTQPPFYRWRKVTFFSFQADEVLRQEWEGWLNERKPQEHSTALQLNCESPETVPKDVVGFRNNPIYDVIARNTPGDRDGTQFQGPTASGGTKALYPEEIRSKVAKKKDANGNDQSTWNQRNFFSRDPSSEGSISPGGYGDASEVMWGCWRPDNVDSDTDADPRIFPMVLNQSRLIVKGEDDPSEDFKGNQQNSWPIVRDRGPGNYYPSKILLGMRVNELGLWKRSFGKAPYPISDAEQVFDNPWHPVAIASMILCSGDHDQIRPQKLDFLNGNIGLDMGWVIDQQNFIDTVNSEGANSIQIDQLILGWKGQTEELFNVVLHLLASHGYFLAPQDDGTVGVAQWKRGTARDLAGATTIQPVFSDSGEDQWDWYPDGTDGQFVVSGKVGNTPLHEPYSIEFFGLDATNRMQRRTDPDGTEYDYRFHKDDSDGRDVARRMLKRQTEYLFANMPSAKFKAPGDPKRDSNKDYSVGSFVILEQPPEAKPNLGVAEDGTFEDMSNPPRDDKYLGQIIARGWNPNENSYTLEVLFTNYDRRIGRDRAPAARVDSYNSDSLIVKTYKGTFVKGVPNNYDAQLFSEIEGAELKLLDGKLQPIDDTSLVKVDEVGGSGSSLSADEIKLDTSFSTDPTDGDIITIANYDIYTFDLSGGFRQYAFWGDASESLGNNDDDADLYV